MGLHKFLCHWQVDHFGLAETHINWKNTPNYYNPHKLFCSKNSMACVKAHGTHKDSHDIMQYGGTMSLSTGGLAPRQSGQGVDPSGLSRWVWQAFKGRDVLTRIYMAYLPCKLWAHQLSTANNQQEWFFRLVHKESICPREAFLRDLQKELQQLELAVDCLVFMLDANCDVQQGSLRKIMDKLNLCDAVLSHHSNTPAPATHQNGSVPIDAIFISDELPVVQASWLSWFNSLDNHRGGLVDIPWKVLVGEDVHWIVWPQAWQLTCGLPHIRERYICYLTQHFQWHQLLQKLYQLQTEQTEGQPLSLEHQHCMQRLDQVRQEKIEAAEKWCCKLCLGAMHYSPVMVHKHCLYYFRKKVLDKKRVLRVSSSFR